MRSRIIEIGREIRQLLQLRLLLLLSLHFIGIQFPFSTLLSEMLLLSVEFALNYRAFVERFGCAFASAVDRFLVPPGALCVGRAGGPIACESATTLSLHGTRTALAARRGSRATGGRRALSAAARAIAARAPPPPAALLLGLGL